MVSFMMEFIADISNKLSSLLVQAQLAIHEEEHGKAAFLWPPGSHACCSGYASWIPACPRYVGKSRFL
jgi:hypothetical protein